MKKYLLIILMFLGVAGVSVAQEEGDKEGGRVEALKIAYLTKKLNLSTEEAQKFWPVYNKYMDEIRKTRQEARQNNQGVINTEEKLLNIRKKYNDEFGKALPSEKVNNF